MVIIILNGPLGVGKSETAWALLERLPRSAMLDVDYLVAVNPFDFYNEEDLEYAAQICATLVEQHLAHGVEHIIVNWVYESAAELRRLTEKLSVHGMPVHAFRLACDPDVLAERIAARGRPDIVWEVQRGQELLGILDRAAADGEVGTLVDTTDLSVEEVVAAVHEYVTNTRRAVHE